MTVAQPQTYKTLKAKDTQQTIVPVDEHEPCLGETQHLLLPEREYDAVQSLIESRREPSEAVKSAIERLKHRIW